MTKLEKYEQLTNARRQDAFHKALNFVGKFALVAILVAGLLSPNTMAHAAMGDLDPTFGVGGIVNTRYLTGPDNAQALATQSDGKIIVVGHATVADSNLDSSISRLNTDGTLDTSFGINGTLIFSAPKSYGGDRAKAVAIQSDDKIVVVGTTAILDNSDEIWVTRFNSNGALDNTFGTAGMIVTHVASGYLNDLGAAIAIQSDGKLVVAGTTTDVNNNKNIALFRFTESGDIDNSFGTGGIVQTRFIEDDFMPSSDTTLAMTLQTDGKIVVSAVTSYQYTTYGIGVARYNTDGTLDTTFDTDGLAIIPFDTQPFDTVGFIAMQGTKILVLGARTNSPMGTDYLMARLNDDGSMDNTFGTNGKTTFAISPGNSPDVPAGLALYDSKIYVAGYSLIDTKYRMTLARLNDNGTLDTTFANGEGYQSYIVGLQDQSDLAYAMTMHGNGKFLVGGSAGMGLTMSDTGVININHDGSIDTTFGNAGITILSLGNTPVSQFADLELYGEKIIAGGLVQQGLTGWDYAAVRYNSNGTLDTTFGNGGFATASPTSTDYVTSMTVQPDGKVLLTGRGDYGGAKPYNITTVRFTADGILDTTFGGTGIVRYASGTNDEGSDIVVQSDGKIVIVGRAEYQGNSHFVLLRYNSDGTLDTTFNSTGIVNTQIGDSSQAFGVAIQPDGKLVVAGTTNALATTDNAAVVARYNSDGTLDTTFGGSNGIVIKNNGPNNSGNGYGGFETLRRVAIQPDGKIVTAGATEPVSQDGTNFHVTLMRFTPDGALDTTFDSDGIVFTRLLSVASDANDFAFGLAFQGDKLVVSGRTTSYLNGLGTRMLLLRYNADGSLDTDFGTGGSVVTTIRDGQENDVANAVVVTPDNRIIVAGEHSKSWVLAKFLASNDPIPPVASVSASQSVQVDDIVTLDGTASSDPDGATPLSYTWTQIGGPSVTFSPNISTTTFSAPSTPAILTFTLTVTDTSDLTSVPVTTTVTVTDKPIQIDASNDGPTYLGYSTTLYASATSGTNIQYTWNLGDGTTAAGLSTHHTYLATGTYTATVSASNSLSTVVASTIVQVVDVPVNNVNLISNSPAYLYETVSITVTSEGTNLSYDIDYGDGTLDSNMLDSDVNGPMQSAAAPIPNSNTFNHFYNEPGLYTVVVTVSNSINSQTETLQIEVKDTPVTDLQAQSSTPTLLGETTYFTYTAFGSNVVFSVDFGDNSIQSAEPLPADSTSHIYATAGIYTATITAANGTNSLSKQLQIVVYEPGQPLAPILKNDAASSKQGIAISGNVLTNDRDPLNNALIVTSFTTPAHGNATVASNGDFTYTPNADFVGIDSFSYSATNGQMESSATLYIVVEPANGTSDQPTVIFLSQTGATIQNVTIDNFRLEFTIPTGLYQGTLSESDILYLVLTPLNNDKTNDTNAPTTYRFAGLNFSIEAYVNGEPLGHISFEQPIQIKASYTNGALGNGTVIELKMYYWDEEATIWTDTGIAMTEVDLAGNTFTMTINHLSEFALFATSTPTGLPTQPQPGRGNKNLFLPTLSNQR